jgi:hypothetical protein
MKMMTEYELESMKVRTEEEINESYKQKKRDVERNYLIKVFLTVMVLILFFLLLSAWGM